MTITIDLHCPAATRKLRRIADYVNIIKDVKSSGLVNDEGIQW
jgi:hypothetical protein